jgi:hypothetical protein
MTQTLGTRRWIAALTAALAFWPVGVAAQEDGGQPGAMLDWSVGARAVAMGSAFTATAEGPSGSWWNPAGIAQTRQDAIEMALRKMSFDRQAGYVNYIHPFGREEAAMGFSWIYAGVGDIFARDIDGQIGGEISDYSNAFAFTFARRFTERTAPTAISLGVNLRYVQHNIANISAYTVGFDLGAQLRHRMLKRGMAADAIPNELRLGVAVQRLNQKYPWTTSDYWIEEGESGGSSFDEKFPVVVRGGVAALLFDGRALGAVDVKVDADRGATVHVGAEGRFRELIAVRAGVDDGRLTFGGGVEPRASSRVRFVLDYAFAVQPDEIDAEHVFSLGVRF